MMRTIARFWRFFSLGFIAGFVVYLFVRWDPDKVFAGVGIAVAAGIVVAVLAEYLRARVRRDEAPEANR